MSQAVVEPAQSVIARAINRFSLVPPGPTPKCGKS
jgi:hypothetical protein